MIRGALLRTWCSRKAPLSSVFTETKTAPSLLAAISSGRTDGPFSKNPSKRSPRTSPRAAKRMGDASTLPIEIRESRHRAVVEAQELALAVALGLPAHEIDERPAVDRPVVASSFHPRAQRPARPRRSRQPRALRGSCRREARAPAPVAAAAWPAQNVPSSPPPTSSPRSQALASVWKSWPAASRISAPALGLVHVPEDDGAPPAVYFSVAQEGSDRLVRHAPSPRSSRHEAEPRLAKSLEEAGELQPRLEDAAFARIAELRGDFGGARHAETPGRPAAYRVRGRRGRFAQQVRPVFASRSTVFQSLAGSLRRRSAARSICTCVAGNTDNSSRSAFRPAAGSFQTLRPTPESVSIPAATRNQTERCRPSSIVYRASSTPMSRSFCSSSAMRTSRGSVMVIPRQVPRATLLSELPR